MWILCRLGKYRKNNKWLFVFKTKWYDHRKSQSKYKHNMWSNQCLIFFSTTSFHMKYSFKKLQKESNWWNKSRNVSEFLMRLLQRPETLSHQSKRTTFFPLFSAITASPFDLLSNVFGAHTIISKWRADVKKHIIGVVLIVPPLHPQLHLQVIDWDHRQHNDQCVPLRPLQFHWSSIAFHKRLRGMEAEASGEEAAVAALRQFQWGASERGL